MATAIAAATASIVSGFAVWWFQSRIEQNRREKEQLRSERVKLYTDLLDPFINVFSSPDSGEQARATERVLSPEFRQIMYRVMLVGSDDVVRAINAMWKQFYANNPDGVSDEQAMLSMRSIGEAWLAVRRELGDHKTQLVWQDVFRARISDFDEHLKKFPNV